ncbi:ABC transporter substrate-binding protein [Ruania halotolerans]|uniref:ABC transporter substrate-binding protein n=1 Tax=Ruania halotolerans TaxID=2897773 RepID=UPI001E3C8B4C|nr:ABC transporter substrate-binding protein [Ruania halotolerans]UFU05653.1 ABC transporter substrate-binding protein [Ruania halotolerans]
MTAVRLISHLDHIRHSTHRAHALCSRYSSVRDITRRHLFGLGAVTTAGVLAGCSTTDETGPETGSQLLDYDYLEFSGEVPADPQRVLVIEGRADLEFALTCGYPVIASGFFFGRDGALFDELDDLMPDDLETFDFAETNEPDYEKIASLEPDLIVMRQNAWVGDFYGNARLSEIAPVLAVASGSTGWQQTMRDQATRLRRDQVVNDEIERYTDLVEEIRARSGPQLDATTLIYGTALDDGGMYVITDSQANEVAADLGINVPRYEPGADENGYVELSPENLDQVSEATTLAIYAYDERPALGQTPTFQLLPAAQSGNVHNLDLTLNQGLARAACAMARRLEEIVTA